MKQTYNFNNAVIRNIHMCIYMQLYFMDTVIYFNIL